LPIDVNLDGFRKRCYNISEDQLLRAGTLPFFIMRFLEGTDILVAEMPKSVFADMQQASEIAIEKKITHNDPAEASIRQEYSMECPDSFKEWILLLIDHAFEFHKLRYGIATEGTQNLYITHSWVNVMEKGDQHYPHMHENSFYSFSCYISCANGDAPFYFIKDNKGTKVDIDKSSEGHVLIFPSQMIHTVYPKKTDGQRVSVSGNIIIRP